VLTAAVARSFSDDSVIRYVLPVPVLRITSCLPTVGQAKATPVGRRFKVLTRAIPESFPQVAQKHKLGEVGK